MKRNQISLIYGFSSNELLNCRCNNLDDLINQINQINDNLKIFLEESKYYSLINSKNEIYNSYEDTEYFNNFIDNNETIKIIKLSNDLNSIYDLIKQQKSYDYINNELHNNEIKYYKIISKYDCYALEYASENLKNNYDIVMVAVTDHGGSLIYASEDLQNNYDIVMAAVTIYGKSLEYASNNLQNNYDIVMAAVTNCGYALGFASKDLQNNNDIVMAAVNCYD